MIASRTTFPQQRLKGPHQDEYDIRVLVFPKSHSHCSNPQLRCISQIQTSSLKSTEFVPHIKYLSSWKLHQRDKFPRWLALKNNGFYIQENYMTIRKGDSAVKRLIYIFTSPGTQHEKSSLESAYTHS